MLLQTRGKMTTRTLAHELEVSRRTILRDLDALSTAGIPIYTEGGHGGGVALDENYRLSLNGLKQEEVRTLFVSGFSTLLDDIGLNRSAESTLLKIFAGLPALHQQTAEQFRQRIHIDPVWWVRETEQTLFWDELQKAVYEDICIQVSYEDRSGEVTERILEPYSLVAKAGMWYLVARRDGEFRTYRVGRFQQITLLDRHFQREPGFDLATFWREQTAEVQATVTRFTCTLRITREGLPFLKSFLPGSSEILEQAEDGDWLTVMVQVPALESAMMLVFGLSGQASVLDPPELHEAVIRSAHEMLKLPAPGVKRIQPGGSLPR